MALRPHSSVPGMSGIARRIGWMDQRFLSLSENCCANTGCTTRDRRTSTETGIRFITMAFPVITLVCIRLVYQLADSVALYSRANCSIFICAFLHTFIRRCLFVSSYRDFCFTCVDVSIGMSCFPLTPGRQNKCIIIKRRVLIEHVKWLVI